MVRSAEARLVSEGAHDGHLRAPRYAAGKLDCALYAVTGEKDGKPEVTRLWFAFDRPGPHVRHTVTVADAVVSTSDMVRNTLRTK